MDGVCTHAAVSGPSWPTLIGLSGEWLGLARSGSGSFRLARVSVMLAMRFSNFIWQRNQWTPRALRKAAWQPSPVPSRGAIVPHGAARMGWDGMEPMRSTWRSRRGMPSLGCVGAERL